MPIIQELLNQDIPNRVRNNHALEHATLHVLQEKGITSRLGGVSDAGGFWIYGDVPTESLLLAAQEALTRLNAGESDLAVHPNCGTNIAVGALAAGGLAWIGMRGTKGSVAKRIARLPVAVLMGVIGYQMAKPLGPKVQEQITTNADVHGLEVLQVLRHDVISGVIIHRVSTRMTK
jgi:hypothetical protein